MDEKETLKTSEKPDAPEVAEKDLDQVNGGKFCGSYTASTINGKKACDGLSGGLPKIQSC